MAYWTQFTAKARPADRRYLTAWPPAAKVYIPAAQIPWASGGASWVVSADSTAGWGERLRQGIGEIDARQRVRKMRDMQEIVSANYG